MARSSRCERPRRTCAKASRARWCDRSSWKRNGAGNGAGVAGEMRINRFSSAVLIGIVLCTSGNDRSFAAGNGGANENVASTATPEEAAMQAVAYKARLAARAAADEGYFLGRRGDFPAARKKFSQAIELDPNFLPRIGFAPTHV